MAGRAHLYEGYTPAQVTFGVRVLGALGVRSMVFTNAAGGINLALERGGLVLISDHINLQGANPLIGPNDDALGPRFPDMTEAYSRKFREMAQTGGHGAMRSLARRRVRRHAGPELRDARRDPLSAHHRRGPGGHVHRARSDRGQPHGDAGAGHFVRHQHGGRHAAARKINHEEVLETGDMVRETLVRFLKGLLPRLAEVE